VNAKKRQADEGGVAVAERPKKASGGGGRWLIAGTILLALLGGGTYAVWQQVRGHVLSGSEYQIDPARIAITPPPAWIHADIAAEVLRDANVDGALSLVDSDLTVRLASAFAAHPWVAHVERVSKHFPSGLDVLLAYRTPVAMVEVENGTAALPVDADGVVLPTQDFSAADAEAYPRIGEIHTTPAGAAGARWGDDNVTGAAQIAAVLAHDWRTLGIFRIVPAGQKPGRSGAEPIFHLITRSGSKITWGRAPSTSMPGEVPAAEKIAQLKRFAAQNGGSLDLPDGGQLEIRDDGALLSRPRPDVKPLRKNGA
jgi:hypothetical protein